MQLQKSIFRDKKIIFNLQIPLEISISMLSDAGVFANKIALIYNQ
jgi:hypothetical protein